MSLQTADRDGTALAYVDTGAGHPPFVFVHGWTCKHTHFAPQIEQFARDHRVVAVDLRGHGDSDAPDQRYTVPALADDVAWLCTHARVEGPVLVGHSMGGQVVLEVAARHPDLAAAVVMVDAAPIVAGSPAVQMAAEIGASLSGPDGAAARAAIADHAVVGLAGVPDLQAQVRDDMLRTPLHVAVSCVTLMGEWDGEAAARASAVPTLHIGAEDPINDAAALRALNPLLRTGQTVGAGHFNQLEVPEQVNAMIERFVAVSLA